jgi:hypothetical protein
MRRILFVLIFNYIYLYYNFAQCPVGDVELYTQADVDLFTATYPDCTSIEGYLFLGDYTGGVSDINNINALNSITNISYGLYIYSTQLTNISAFNNLTTNYLDVDISNNALLNSIASFSSILNGGYISIYGNESLTSIQAFQSMTSANSLSIDGNVLLDELAPMSNLSSIGSISINNNNNLQNINGIFPNLTNVNGVSFGNLSNINSLPFWGNITSLNYLSLNYLPDIYNLNFLNSNLALSSIYAHNNPLLSICNNTPVCNLILTQLPGSNNISVSNNSNGCNSFDEIWSGCTELPYCSTISYPKNGQRVGVKTKVQWTSSSFATGYKISAGTSPGSTNILNNFDVGNVLTYKFNNSLPYNSSIYVKITPYNVYGNAIGNCMERYFLTYWECPFGYQNFNQSVIDSFPSWFPNCTHLNGVQIHANRLDSLYNITSVSNFLTITSDFLGTEMKGLHNITSVNGNLDIYGYRIVDLSSLESVYGNLELHPLKHPLKLNSLTTVSGDFLLVGDQVNASSLSNLSSVTNLNIVGFTSLVGLENLLSIPGDLIIGIEHLPNLNGLENLTFVGGKLYIGDSWGYGPPNPLNNINALANLESVEGLSIFETSLTNLNSLSNLDLNSIHTLAICDNPYLNDISGLNGIVDITNTLDIEQNFLLSDCDITPICNVINENIEIKEVQYNKLGCNSIVEIQIACSISMAINMITFQAVKNNLMTYLFWQTTSENSLTTFSIQRSPNAQQWEDIGILEAKNEAEGVQSYSLIDNQPLKGTNYYRLRINDQNGNFEYSPVRSVYFGEGRDNDFEAYGSDKTITLINNNRSNIHYFVYNSIGRIVADTYDTKIPVPQSGIYLVSDGISTKKVFVR